MLEDFKENMLAVIEKHKVNMNSLMNQETDCPCGKPENHNGGEVEGCLEGGVIKSNL